MNIKELIIIHAVGGSTGTIDYSLHELILVAVYASPPKYYAKLSASSLQVQTIG